MIRAGIFLLILFISSQLMAQMRIGTLMGDLQFQITPPKNVKRYYIYWYPFSSYMVKHLKSNRILHKRLDFNNGREIKITDYFENKIGSIEQNFYKNALMVRKIISYPSMAKPEVYYYKYGKEGG